MVILNHFMMRQGRRLKLLLTASIFLCAFLLVVSFGNSSYDRYTTEQAILRCGISICTPCQYLDPEENTDVLDTFYNSVFESTQYKTFPPPTTADVEDLPISGVDRIERILHQKWNTKHIPIQFRKYIKSFIDNHLSWQYMFWTDQSTRQFIQDHYPSLLSLYDNYASPLNRADSMRYMILFYYGGVYSDLDVQSLRPLDPMIKKYSCFLAQEPHVHSIVYTNFYEQASTAFMACRKRHPFMRNVLNNLHSFYYFANEHDSTGPRFLTYLFREYSKQTEEMELTDNDYVYLTPPEYFNPIADPGLNNLLSMQCSIIQCLSALRKWQCEQWRMNGVRSEPYKFSFTIHMWAHIAYQDMHSLTYIDIIDISPDASIYE